MSGWKTPKRHFGRNSQHVKFQDDPEYFNLQNSLINYDEASKYITSTELDSNRMKNSLSRNSRGHFQSTENFNPIPLDNTNVLTMQEQLLKLAAITNTENKENSSHKASYYQRYDDDGILGEIHSNKMCPNGTTNDFRYLNDTESLLPATEYIKKLGAAEYELKQVKKKVNELQSTVSSKEKDEYDLRLEMDTLQKVMNEKNEELAKFNEKIEQMKKYMAQLPAVDETDKWKSNIKNLQSDKRKLEAINSMLNETNASLQKKLKEKEKDLGEKLKQVMETETKLEVLDNDFENYKEKIRSITNFRNKLDIENVFIERDKYKENLSHMEKILEIKQNSIEKLKVESQNSKHNFEERLAQEENTVIALKGELSSKDQIIKDLRDNMKQLNSNKQEIFTNNLELQLRYENFKQSVDENENGEIARKELYEELCLCYGEFSSLVNAFIQHASGTDPNISLLLGTKDVDDQDTSLLLSSSSSKKLQEIKDLRQNVLQLRRELSDQYIKSLGEKCIMQ